MTPQVAERKRRADYEAEKRRRAEYLELLRGNENHPQHGTTTGYGYGCRCERCRDAYRQAKIRRRGKPPAWHYNFPAYRELPCEADSASVEAQAQKVVEEALELAEAAHKNEGSDRVMEEALDVMQAVETLLRTYGSKRVFDARNGVIGKNRERGYYGGGR